jgi:YVTN family beta-propeller protein
VSYVSRANGQECVPDFRVVAEIAVQRGAVSGIAISPDGMWLMVTHQGDNSFSLIDTAENAVAHTVIDVDEPFAIAVSDIPTGRAYVSTVSAAYDSILAFDIAANRVVATHPVANSVTDVAVSPDGRYVYVSRNAVDGADIAILDTRTGKEDTIGIAAAAGATAGCVRVSSDGRRLYVAANGPYTAEIVVIDPHYKRVLETIEIGSPIRDIALSPNGATAYIGSCGPDFGAVLDVLEIGHTRSNTLVNTYKLGEIAGVLAQLVLSRDGERAYLVGDTSVTVWSTSTNDVIGSIVTGARPSCVTESPDGDRVYVADYAGAITVLTTASTDARTPDEVPTAPHQWAWSTLAGLEPALA